MKVYIPRHKFAWSIRTLGFPLIAYDEKGNRVLTTSTQKRAICLELPDNSTMLAWFYESNRGNRSVYLYELPSLKCFRVIDEGSYKGNLENDLGKDVEYWLCHKW